MTDIVEIKYQVHYLKTWPEYFDAVLRGEKTFEVRRDDRGFQKGDLLVLQRTFERDRLNVEYKYVSNPKPNERLRAKYEITARIGYILTGGQFGIEPGFVVMGLYNVDASNTLEDEQ